MTLNLKVLNRLPLRQIIVFESQNDMDDNPRAVFDYMLEKGLDRDYLLVWIVKDVNRYREAFPAKNVQFVDRSDASFSNQLRLQYILSCARWFVFSHPWWYHKRRKEQIVINTGHGIGLKGATDNPDIQESFDFAIAPSPLSAEWTCKFWRMPEKKIVFLGAPRNDELFVRDKAAILKRMLPIQEGEKTVICLPTYRQSRNQVDCRSVDRFCLSAVQTETDLRQLDQLLDELRIHLLVKPHPLQLTEKLKQISLSHIHYINDSVLLERDIRLYSLIGCCDAMLTDYSSAYFGYLLLNRPIGFLTRDHELYQRGFIIENPLDYMPGDRIDSFEDLVSFLRDLAAGKDAYDVQRQQLNEVYNGAFSDDTNCEAFVEWLCKLP